MDFFKILIQVFHLLTTYNYLLRPVARNRAIRYTLNDIIYRVSMYTV